MTDIITRVQIGCQCTHGLRMTLSHSTPDPTDCAAKAVAAPDTTRGSEGTCSPEFTDWGADDQLLEEWRPKNELGRAERTHKSQTAP
mmetsp:Transcript_99677/g.168148  ORF Transcript_99677/g.168148 Transcript_99677/m.168148 type:complete len:87 (-) Transcript_99677:4-264(-)